MSDGPVTIREVYAIAEDIKKEVKGISKEMAAFRESCGNKAGGLDKRVSMLEDKTDKLQYIGRENRGFIFYSLMMMLSAVIGATSVILVEFVR